MPSMQPTTIGKPNFSSKLEMRISILSSVSGNLTSFGPRPFDMALHTLRIVCDSVDIDIPKEICNEPYGVRGWT